MKRIVLRVVQVLLVATLTACTFEMPKVISATAEKHVSGAPVKTWTLTKTQAGLLAEWFRQYPSGWSPSYASYAPRLQVRLKHVNEQESSVNILPQGLVVVISKGGQFTKSFEAKKVEQLVELIEANDG